MEGGGWRGGRKRKNRQGFLTFNWTDQMDFESLRKKKKKKVPRLRLNCLRRGGGGRSNPD